MTATAFDVATLRRAFSGFPSGVVAVSAVVDDVPEVLIVSSFTVGVSQDPPLVMFAVQHTSTTWPVLARAERLGVSVLGDAHTDRVRQLAARDKADRWRDIPRSVTDAGAVVLHDAPMVLECSVWSTHAAGDHDIVVLRVEELATDFDHSPLVWHRAAFTTLA